jgi:4-hydroxybenzoyl-CoA thioesterase
MLVHRSDVRIEWGDCDPAGIVYFPRYLVMFDAATATLFERVGFKKPLLLQTFGIIGFPAVSVRSTFTVPCSFGDDVVIESTIAEWGRSSFKTHHRLLKDDALAVEGWLTRVWAVSDPSRPSGIRGEAIPESLKARFENG